MLKINWKWIYPGLKIKRWVIVISIGVMMLVSGTMCLSFGLLADPLIDKATTMQGFLFKLSAALISVGFISVITGVICLVKSVEALYLKRNPASRRGLVELAYEERGLSQGPKIIAFGGGTGLFNLLSGLKKYTRQITAVTTVADDGGSSGRLRTDMDIPPPGDIRNCLVALAESESLMENIMQYRFEDSEFSGHCFGNLLLAVLSKVKGSFADGVHEAHNILSVRGRVVPVVPRKLTLEAVHPDGTKTTGQDAISKCTKEISRIKLNPPPGDVSDEIKTLIREADIIVYGPGSLFTSVIPNIIVNGMEEALHSSRAIKIYVCNTMTQAGETSGFSVEDHVNALERHSSNKIIDMVLINNGPITEDHLKIYRNSGSDPVSEGSIANLEARGYSILHADVVNDSHYIHHHPDKLSRALMEIYRNENAKKS